MIKPRKHNDHSDIIEKAGLKDEKAWLARNYQFSGPQSEEYIKRATAFNARCRDLGATLMAVAV